MPRRVTIGALTPILPTGVDADDRHDDDDNDGSRFRVAAGASAPDEQSPYVGGDDSVEVLPRLFVQMGHFYLRGLALGVYPYGSDDLSVSAGISLDLADTHRGDSPQLADISGPHGGFLVGHSDGYPVEIGRWQIEPEFGVKWHSAEVDRHYYGVGAADVWSAHPLYEPDAGMSCEVGVTVTYPLAERHALSLEAGAEWLSTEVSDNPIVDQGSLASGGVGYPSRF